MRGVQKTLEGKSTVVTGSASGIGKATALLFARQGARVVVADINEEAGRETVRAICEEGGQATFLRTDVREADDVKEMIDFAVRTYGRLDVLVNNAGIGHRIPVHRCTEEDWENVIATNLTGVFLGCKYGVQAMLRQEGGVIVNIASGAGLLGAPRSPAYSAAKGGVVVLTRQIADDYAQDGIRINAVCPGAVDTPLMDVVYHEISDDLEEGKRIYESRLTRGACWHQRRWLTQCSTSPRTRPRS